MRKNIPKRDSKMYRTSTGYVCS